MLQYERKVETILLAMLIRVLQSGASRVAATAYAEILRRGKTKMPETTEHAVGKTIAALRKSKGWTQIELAEKLNISDKAVSKWEKDIGSPSVEFFPALAALFGVSIDYLMTGARDDTVVCSVCGEKNDSTSSFCAQCGSPLVNVCRGCGSPLKPRTKFCIKCGLRVGDEPAQSERNDSVGKNICSGCGATIDTNAAFCMVCGQRNIRASSRGNLAGDSGEYAPQNDVPPKSPAQSCSRHSFEDPQRAGGGAAGVAVGANNFDGNAAYREQTAYGSPQRRAVRGAGSYRAQIGAYEKRTGIVSNAIVAVMSAVFLLVSLLCPLKIYFGLSMDGSPNVAINQSVYQVLDSVGYIGLDYQDSDDRDKVRDIFKDFESAYTKAESEYSVWKKANPKATLTELEEQNKKILAKHLSDVNVLGFKLALSTVGALNDIYEQEYGDKVDVEKLLGDMLDVMYNVATFSAVTAAVVAILQLIIAAISLAFLIASVVNIVAKKRGRVFGYLATVAALSVVGLLALAIVPQSAPSGSMFVMAILALSTLAVLAVAKHITMRNVAAVSLTAGVAVLVSIAFFMLCTEWLELSLVTKYRSTSTTTAVFATVPIGDAITELYTVYMMFNIPDLSASTPTIITVAYSNLSAATFIVTFILGVVAFIVMATAVFFAVRSLVKQSDEAQLRSGITAAIGSIILIAMAIASSVMASAGTLPDGAVTLTCKVELGAYAYVSLAFGVLALCAAIPNFVVRKKRIIAAVA